MLRGLLGLSADEVEDLSAIGAIAERPIGAPEEVDSLDLGVMLASGSLARIDPDYLELLAGARQGAGRREVTTAR